MDTLATLGFRADTSDLRRAEQDLNRISRASGETERGMLSMSNAIKVATAAIAALGVGRAIMQVADFSQAIADLSAITGAAGADLEYYRKQAQEIGRTTSLSASQAAEAFKLIASAKPDLLSSAEALNAVTREAVTLAEAAGITLPEAAQALGSALNQFGLEADKANEVINILAASSQLGTASVASVTEAMRNAGAAANSLGIDVAETVAGIQALAAAGREGADAGTALRQVMLRLESTGDQTLMPSLVGLNDALLELKSRNLDNTQLMKLFGQEAFTAAASLLAQTDTVTRLNTELRGTNTAAEQADTRMNTLTGDLKAMGSAIEGLKIAVLGDEVEGLNRDLVQLATGGINFVTENLDALAKSAAAAAAVVALSMTPALAKSVIAFGSATASSIAYQVALARMAGVSATAAAASTALGVAVKVALGPIGLMLAALGAAAAAFSYYSRESEAAKQSSAELKLEIDKLTSSMDDLTEAQAKLLQLKIADRMDQIEQQLKTMSVAAGATSDELAAIFGDEFKNGAEVAAVNAEALQAELVRLGEQSKIVEAILAGTAKNGVKPVSKAVEELAGNNDNLIKSFADQVRGLAMQKSELTMTTDAYEEFVAVQAALAYGAGPAAIEVVRTQVRELQALRRVHGELNGLMDGGLFGFGDVDTSELDNLINRVNDFGGAWSAAGSAMIGAFGGIADALGDYSKRMEGLIELQNKLTAEKDNYAAGSQEAARADIALAEVQFKMTMANLNGMSRAAGAAASLFKEQSKERKALHNAEKAFAAVEIALALQKASANAMTAISSAFTAPPPLGFAMGAAMIGIMSGLGLFSGSSGGAPATNSGTGTTLGSDDASNSLAQASEEYKGIALDQLAELRKIRDSMNSLNNGIAQLAKSLIVGGQLGGAGVTGLGTTSQFSANGLFGSSITGVVDRLTGGIMGGVLNSIIGGISKTTKSLVDSGLQFDPQQLGDVLADGFEGYYFNVIETTKKKLWGLSKKTSTETQTEALDNAILNQITAIFGFLADAVSGAVDVLGVDMVNTLESFNIKLGNISFEGLSGEEIQKKLEQVISAQGDLMAEYVLPQIKQYQQIGEGALETLLRVSKEQAVFNDALDMIGQNLGDLSNLMRIDVAQSIITMMGGLEAFTDAVGLYFKEFFSESEQLEYLTKSLTEAMGGLGYELPETREGFRALVDSLDLTTEAGQAAFAALMELVPSMAEYFKQLEKQTGAFADFEGAAKGAFEMLKKSVQVEKDRAQEALRTAQETYRAEIDRINGVKRAIEQVYETLQDNLANAETALLRSRDAEIDRINSVLAGAVAIRDAEISRLNDVKAAIQQQYAALETAASAARDGLLRSRDVEIERVREGLKGAQDLRDAELARIADVRSAIQSQYADLQAALNNAAGLLNRSLRAESERIESGYRDLVESGAAAESALKAAFNAEKDAIQQAANLRLEALNQEAQAARQVANDLRRVQQQYQINAITIDQALKAARGGDFSLAQQLQVSDVSSAEFSSAADFAAAQALQANRLNEIGELAGKQASVAERTLSAAEAQIEQLKLSTEQQLVALDEQLNAALGIDTSVLSIADALAQYQAAQQAIADYDVETQRDQLAEQQRIADLLTGVDNSVVAVVDALKAYQDAQLAIDEFAYDAQLAALDDLIDAANDAYTQAEQLAAAQIDAINAQVDAALGIDNSVMSLSAAIGEYQAAQSALSSFNLEQQLAYVDAQINIANMQLEQAQQSAASQIAALNAQIDALLGIDNTVLSVGDAIAAYQAAQLALDEFNYDEQISKLDLQIKTAEDLLSLAEKAYADEIARLDALLADSEAQLNALLGIDTSIKSLDDAMRGFVDAISNLAKSMDPPPAPPAPDQAVNELREELRSEKEKNAEALRAIAKSSERTAVILQRIEFENAMSVQQ